jgi:ribonuclease J
MKNKHRKDLHSPPADELWFLPLGGSGEIGMNLNLYGTAGKWLMVDCGVTFGDDTTPGVEIIMPDIGFIAERRDDLVGIVITHGHEDHIGALEYLWGQLQVPVYATPFTAQLLRTKLTDHRGMSKARIVEVPLGGRLELGPFAVDFIGVTHSIPEANMLTIKTGLGSVLHTGDWKLDPQPLVGALTEADRLRVLAQDNILAVIGDSTNALVAGHTASEAEAGRGLRELFGTLQNRIAVTLFASNIARVKSIAAAAKACRREVALIGRSLWRNAEIAEMFRYLPEFTQFLEPQDAALVPRNRVVYICTGSQGEERSALARIAAGNHRDVVLEAGDHVIYSSRDIPGNEKAIGRIQNMLTDMGIDILTQERVSQCIHASGHAAQDELQQLYHWVKPRAVIPVHGELRHQTAHVALAKSCGVEQALIPSNGQIIRLDGAAPAVVGEVQFGQWGLDGKSLRPMGRGAVKDRHKMGQTGAAVATIVIDRAGKLLKEPQLSLMGVADAHELAGLAHKAGAIIAHAIETMPKSTRIDDDAVSKIAGQALKRCLNEWHGKKPMTEIHIVRV